MARLYIAMVCILLTLTGCLSRQSLQSNTSDILPIRATSEPNTSSDNAVSAAKTLPSVSISGSLGEQGIVLTGFPSTTITGADGCYSTQVPSGWSGTIEPRLPGSLFTPESRSYQEITEPLFHENYQTRPESIVLSGSTGVANVPIFGFPNLIQTDSRGLFETTVPFGWSGQISPSHTYGAFLPETRQYHNVSKSMFNQDFHLDQGIPQTMTCQALDRKASSRTSHTSAPPLFISDTSLIVWKNSEPNIHATEIQEDLLVLGTILRENTGQASLQTGVRMLHTLYLEGYGVVMTAHLEHPQPWFLPGAAAAGEESDDPNARADSIWSSTRARLFPDTATDHHDVPSQQLNLPFLNSLIDHLTVTLREAGNFRHVKPGEVVVMGLVAPNGQTLTVQTTMSNIHAFSRNHLDKQGFKNSLGIIFPAL